MKSCFVGKQSVSSSRRFFQVIAGEPWYEAQGINYEECCHCGLVHKIKYEVHDKEGKQIKGARVRLTAWESIGLTRQRRALRKKSIAVPT